jgi:hypothetical protein
VTKAAATHQQVRRSAQLLAGKGCYPTFRRKNRGIKLNVVGRLVEAGGGGVFYSLPDEFF